MNITFGFGSTETNFENAEIKAFREFCLIEYRRMECDYITGDLFKSCRAWLIMRAKELTDKRDGFKDAAEYPPRYSAYSPTVLHDASHIVAIFRFAHVSRHHAFSPDGWALMSTEVCIVALDAIDVRSTAPEDSP